MALQTECNFLLFLFVVHFLPGIIVGVQVQWAQSKKKRKLHWAWAIDMVCYNEYNKPFDTFVFQHQSESVRINFFSIQIYIQ